VLRCSKCAGRFLADPSLPPGTFVQNSAEAPPHRDPGYAADEAAAAPPPSPKSPSYSTSTAFDDFRSPDDQKAWGGLWLLVGMIAVDLAAAMLCFIYWRSVHPSVLARVTFDSSGDGFVCGFAFLGTLQSLLVICAAFYIAAVCRRSQQGSAVGWIVLTIFLNWIGLGLFLVNRQSSSNT
jgi:hypothetical protein